MNDPILAMMEDMLRAHHKLLRLLLLQKVESFNEGAEILKELERKYPILKNRIYLERYKKK